MRKQVLILNVTRMGDLVQTARLLSRLEHEWPGVAVDLAVDTRFAPMALLLPGLRQVLPYDFHAFLSTRQEQTDRSEALPAELTAWINPLRAAGYDRVINLTFTRWSGLLTAAIGVPDTRGAVTINGITILKNPWLAYCVDMHQFRRFNRFNVADLFALGGSGPGSHQPIRFTIPSQAVEWARDRRRVRPRKPGGRSILAGPWPR